MDVKSVGLGSGAVTLLKAAETRRQEQHQTRQKDGDAGPVESHVIGTRDVRQKPYTDRQQCTNHDTASIARCTL